MRSAVIVSLLLGFGGLACQRKATELEQRVAAVTVAAPRWEQGAKYAYQLKLETQTRMGASEETLHISLEAELELVPQGDARVAARFNGARVLAGAGEQKQGLQPLADDLAKPFVVTFMQGRVSELHLPDATLPLTTGIQRTIAAALQFAPGTSADGWSGSEFDATGEYVAEYKAAEPAGSFTKKKLRYLKLTTASGAPALKLNVELVPEVVASHAEIRLEGGVLKAVEQKDEIRTQLRGSTGFSSTTRVDLALKSKSPVTALPVGLEGLTRIAAGQPSPQPGLRRTLESARIAGMTVDRAIAELETLERTKAEPVSPRLARGDTDDAESEGGGELGRKSSVFISLAALLRVEPDALPKVIGSIRKGNAASIVLLDVLSSAGTEPAQAALVALARDRSLKEDLRVRAVRSLIRTEMPSATTVEALIDFAGEPLLSTHGIYGLGTAARRLREADRPETSDRAASYLIERLAAAKSDTEKVHVLRGIANSGHARALPSVRALLDHQSSAVRGAAVEALRLMRDPAVDPLLAQQLTVTDSGVLLAALNSMKVREPSDVLSRALTQFARSTSDPYARLRAVELLGRWLPRRAELRPVIQELAQSDSRPRIREAARAALGT